MFIKQVELTNVKSYGAETQIVHFGEGVNLIAGGNGAGKSTILEAIGYVLFDALPYSQGDFTRRGGSGVSRVVVQMQSVDDGRLYAVERTVDPSRYKVVDVDENINQGIDSKTELIQWLQQHLRVNQTADLAALFNNAIGMQQGTITSVFLDTPANRKSTFDALLRVQDYEDAWKSLLETENHIKELINDNEKSIIGKETTIEAHEDKPDEAETLRKSIATDQSELSGIEDQIEQVKADVEQLDTLKEKISERQRLQEKLDDATEKKSTLTTRIAEIEPQVEQRESLNEEIAELEKQRDTLDADIEQLNTARDALENQKKEADDTLKKSHEQQNVYQEIKREIKRIEEEIEFEQTRKSEIENQLEQRDELTAHIDDAEQAIAEAQSRKTEAETTIQAAQNELNELQEMRTLLSEEGAVCPVCRQEMGEQAHAEAVDYYDSQEAELNDTQQTAQTQIGAAEATIKEQKEAKQTYENERKQLPNETALADVEQRISQLNDDLNTQQEKLADMPDVQTLVDDAESDVEQAQAALAEHDEQINEKKDQRQKLGDDIGEKQGEKANLASRDDLERAKGELDELQTDMDKTRTALDELENLPEYNADNHQEAKDEYDDLIKQQSRLETAIEMNQEKLDDIQDDIKKLQEARADLEQLQQKAETLDEHLVTFQFVRSGIRQAGPRIREQKVKIVSQVASRYFNEILNDYTMTLAWDADNYGIRVEQDGEVRAFNVLSGGEQMIAALSVRLALLTNLTSIRLIFLDEPTINLDENRRVMLAEQLSKIDDLRQLFVISHDDTFIEESQHVIRVTKTNGFSEVAS